MSAAYPKIIVLFAIVLFSACSKGQVQNKLSPNEFYEKIKQNPQALLMDVRTPEEYANGHLEKAQNMDWNGAHFEDQIATLDKSQPIYVYCLSGGRSSAAAERMRSLGFRQVYELDGGISQWRNKGLPEIKGSENKSTGMSKQAFDKLLDSDMLVLINFYARWCTPCKQMEPYLAELRTEKKETVTIIRIDADEHQALFKELAIGTIPTLLLYKNKKLIWSHEGYINKEDLLKQLTR
jgi:thioredoxin